MNVTKAATTAGVGAAIVVGSMFAVTAASAQSSDRRAELVDRLATELNVNSADVQGVFDELKAEHKVERAASAEAHLQSLVDAGTLTEAQKADLEGFQEARQSLKESLKDQDLSKDEMKAQFMEMKAEVEAWADAEGLDLDDIRPERDGEHRKGRRGFGGEKPDHAETTDEG
ncbi:MAG: hypothetical protein ACI9T8_000379 [Candidatus Saccharimonadales bacterium]|jgi:hypothetical protein